MQQEERWAPPGVDPTKASVARVYDYLVGGKDNFEIDRQVAEMGLKIAPDAKESTLANRAFLRRAIRFMAREAGIRQFLDLGSGLPTQGNVHEVAHETHPTAHVVYVDYDPMALAHGRALLADAHTTTVVQGDVRHPADIVNDPAVRALIDFDQPVGLLMFAILHHVNDDEDPAGVARYLREAVAPGSHLAISHFHNPGAEHPDVARDVARAEELFNRTMGTGRWRTRAEILSYFGDFDLLEPGLVPLPEWRPDLTEPTITLQPNTYYTFVGGVARKP